MPGNKSAGFASEAHEITGMNWSVAVLDGRLRQGRRGFENLTAVAGRNGKTERLASEQIRSLVGEVFLTTAAPPVRQVVFSAIDERGKVDAICAQVGAELAAQIMGDVAIVEANLGHGRFDGRTPAEPTLRAEDINGLRESSRQMSDRLWFVPWEVLARENDVGSFHGWLPERLAQLRREFDYSVIQGPPAGSSGDVAVLGKVSDGLILIVEANLTRRAVAQQISEMLEQAQVWLLGAVLTERTFPIPERIYRKL